MIYKFLSRLEHGLIRRPSYQPMLYNSELNLKIKRIPLEVHKFIVFKNYSGNEILYSLKDCYKLQPGEISSALLELGIRKGAPKGYDWNNHPCIISVLEIIKEKIPQYSCRVLTSLAHGLNRLNIKDAEIWDLLETHILRTCTSIDSPGLAYTLYAFIGRDKPELFTNLIELIPAHINHMIPRDVCNIVISISVSDSTSDRIFQKFLYPYLKENLNSFTISQIKECLKALKNRKETKEK